MALKRRGPEPGLLHHSDRGCTYASEDYQRRLDAHGITCSMSRTGDCYDNAVMEAFFSTVKTELAERFESCGHAKMELFDYIEVFYNQRRRHSTIDYMSPAAIRAPVGAQRRRGTRGGARRQPCPNPYVPRPGRRAPAQLSATVEQRNRSYDETERG